MIQDVRHYPFHRVCVVWTPLFITTLYAIGYCSIGMHQEVRHYVVTDREVHHYLLSLFEHFSLYL